MADPLEQFIADVKNSGVDIRSIDFSLTFDLRDDVSNISAGMLRGLGPRYGMSPLVSQSIQQAVDANGTYGVYGSSTSTTDTARAVYGCFRVFSIVSFPMIDQTDIGTVNSPKQSKNYFWACIGIAPTAGAASGATMLAWVPLGTSSSTFAWVPKAAIAYGLLRPLVLDNIGAAATANPGCYRLAGVNGAGGTSEAQFRNLQTIAQTTGNVDYCATAVLAVPGQNVPAAWVVGARITVGDVDTSATSAFGSFGCPNFPIDRKFTQGSRCWTLYNIGGYLGAGNIGLQATYIFSKTPTYTDLLAIGDQNIATANLTGTFVDGSATLVQRLDGTAPTYADVGRVLWNDPANYLNTEHSLLLAAPGKPLAIVVQSWQRNDKQKLEQWVDLRCRALAPGLWPTVDVDTNSGRYTEGMKTDVAATAVATCWKAWEPFVDKTPTRTLASLNATRSGDTVGVALGAANSGILRANTIYEFAFSVYDKQLGVESNVGAPAKILTDTADFVALCIFADQVGGGAVTGGAYKQRCINNGSSFGLVLGSQEAYLRNSAANSTAVTNYIELRIYYRAFGAFEWLPALFIDAAEYFWSPNLKELMACTGAIAGTVGGQPGGFNDYSDLPDDTYNCVLVWKQRVFWLSQKTLLFSMTNNGFSYPVRNAAQIPQGQYKGAIVHNYPGQAEQDSRLIVFGSVEIYVGKFTGALSQMSVQVDPDNLATFFVDGSDFVLNSWTSITAFSYRSACVAMGILYYWGPQGIFRDDGRDTPTKISDVLEPNIFSFYAKQRTDDIHCTYSEQTKEITWYYFDNDVYAAYDATVEQTKLLIYNTQTETFYFGGTSACIDASMKINSGSSTMDLVRETGGDRTMIMARLGKAATGVQQPYFYDYRNRSGDLRYGLERLVNVIATPVAGTRRLTLPNGATGIAVGDYIATDQINAYTNDQDAAAAAIIVQDFVGKVTAVNTSGTNYIDVLMPTNIDPLFSAAATLNAITAFPIYVSKTIMAATASAGNAFPYQISSQYWCPSGLSYNAFWLYVHLLFKIELIKAEGLDTSFGFTLSHRTPVSLAFYDQAVVFGEMVHGVWTSTLNSDGNQQMYVPLVGVDQMEGQGIKLKFSGLHYAHRWVLQYLSAFANPQVYDFLKRFEV